jgi:hypothetical protein
MAYSLVVWFRLLPFSIGEREKNGIDGGHPLFLEPKDRWRSRGKTAFWGNFGMNDLPASLKELIFAATIRPRRPAFLAVDRNGRLGRQGGELERYGLGRLHEGDRVEEEVFWLQDLFPLQEECQFFPWVQTGNGLAVDLYLLKGGEDDWVLLLEATQEEIQRREMQQAANEFSLTRERLERERDGESSERRECE